MLQLENELFAWHANRMLALSDMLASHGLIHVLQVLTCYHCRV